MSSVGNGSLTVDCCIAVSVLHHNFCDDNRFLFLLTISSTLSDSEMSIDSEDSEIYYIAEENDISYLSTTQSRE